MDSNDLIIKLYGVIGNCFLFVFILLKSERILATSKEDFVNVKLVNVERSDSAKRTEL